MTDSTESYYYIVSIKHTKRSDPYITIWRPDDCGYAYPLSWAGRYAEAHVLSSLGYYNSGHSDVTVTCHVLDSIAVNPSAGMIDNDAGPVVLNNAASWRAILENVIRPTIYESIPKYKAKRRKGKAIND